MRGKKIRKIPGIGPTHEYYLKGLGIETASDLLDNIDILAICYSQTTTNFLLSAALGLGPIEHDHKERKSVGKSTTFQPTDNVTFITNKLKDLCEEVESELI